MRRQGHIGGDDGQAMVEAAIIIPAILFLILMILQLTMVQHARIMTEYAVYCAARAGIVYNGEEAAMERAALTALLPTMGRTDSATNIGKVLARERIEQEARNLVGAPKVNVVIKRPRKADVPGALTRHTRGAELDFDDVRPAAIQANILEIELIYMYKMRIPFANQMLLALLAGHQAGLLKTWTGADALAPQISLVGGDPVRTSIAAGASKLRNGTQIAILATTLRQFYFPLYTTTAMRMQSNLYVSKLP